MLMLFLILLRKMLVIIFFFSDQILSSWCRPKGIVINLYFGAPLSLYLPVLCREILNFMVFFLNYLFRNKTIKDTQNWSLMHCPVLNGFLFLDNVVFQIKMSLRPIIIKTIQYFDISCQLYWSTCPLCRFYSACGNVIPHFLIN